MQITESNIPNVAFDAETLVGMHRQEQNRDSYCDYRSWRLEQQIKTSISAKGKALLVETSTILSSA